MRKSFDSLTKTAWNLKKAELEQEKCEEEEEQWMAMECQQVEEEKGTQHWEKEVHGDFKEEH